MLQQRQQQRSSSRGGGGSSSTHRRPLAHLVAGLVRAIARESWHDLGLHVRVRLELRTTVCGVWRGLPVERSAVGWRVVAVLLCARIGAAGWSRARLLPARVLRCSTPKDAKCKHT